MVVSSSNLQLRTTGQAEFWILDFGFWILDYKRSTWGDSKTALLSKFIYRGNLKSKIVNPKSFDRLGYSNFSVDI